MDCVRHTRRRMLKSTAFAGESVPVMNRRLDAAVFACIELRRWA